MSVGEALSYSATHHQLAIEAWERALVTVAANLWSSFRWPSTTAVGGGPLPRCHADVRGAQHFRLRKFRRQLRLREMSRRLCTPLLKLTPSAGSLW